MQMQTYLFFYTFPLFCGEQNDKLSFQAIDGHDRLSQPLPLRVAAYLLPKLQ